MFSKNNQWEYGRVSTIEVLIAKGADLNEKIALDAQH